MCLIKIRDGKGDLPLIAVDDISVWKILNNNYSSIYNNFKYEVGVLNKVGILESDELRCYDENAAKILILNFGLNWHSDKALSSKVISYGQGFHSALTKERLMENQFYYKKRLVEFIIPKGSEYHLDGSGLVVSNKIIMTDNFEFINTFDVDNVV